MRHLPTTTNRRRMCCMSAVHSMACVRARPAVAEMIGERAANVVRSSYFAAAFMTGFPLVGILLPVVSHVTVVLTIPAMLYTCIKAFRGCSELAKATLRPTFRRALFFAVTALICWCVGRRTDLTNANPRARRDDCVGTVVGRLHVSTVLRWCST